MKKTDKHVVGVEVTVPHGTDGALVTSFVEGLLYEALNLCDDILGISDFSDARPADLVRAINALMESAEDPDTRERIREIKKCEFKTRMSRFVCTEGTNLDFKLDPDDAAWFGDGFDGVYVQIFQDPVDDLFWALCVIDCDTSGVVETLCIEGPFDHESEAKTAGRNVAMTWCDESGIPVNSVNREGPPIIV